MDKAEYIDKYVKKVHDTVRLLSTVKTTVTVALRQVDKGMNDLHDELDALMPKDKEASTPPPVKKRKVVTELNLSYPSQFTWQEFFKKSDVTLLKKEDYDKAVAAYEAAKLEWKALNRNMRHRGMYELLDAED